MDRLPPHNIEAEQAVLAGLMLDGAETPLIAAELSADDFYRTPHKDIFKAICEIHAAGQLPDEILVRELLKKKGLLERTKGCLEIHSVPSAANIENYAGIVKEKATARKIIAASSTSLMEVEDGIRPEEILARAIVRLKGVVDTSSSCSLASMSEALDAWKNQPRRAGHPTGLEDLDMVLNGGFHPGGITLVGGDAKAGKTVLVLQGLRNAVGIGTPVLVISRDQLWFQLAARVWSAESGVPRQFLTEDPDALKIEKLLRDWPLWWYRGRYDLASVCAGIKLSVANHGIRMWALDYLQRIHCPQAEKSTQASVLIAEALADVAQDTNTYGVVISRVTKPTQGVSRQHRFAGEAGVQNAADTMVFIEKPKGKESPDIDERPREIHVIGGRYCGDGVALAVLQGSMDRFRAATSDEKERWHSKGKRKGIEW